MRRVATIMGSLLAGLTLLLLVVDLHIAKTTDKVDSSQTIASAKAGSDPLGANLHVHLAGDPALAAEIREKLTAHIPAPGRLPGRHGGWRATTTP